MTHQSVLILDFGSQTTQLIARRVREAGVYCEIHPCTTPIADLADESTIGVILSGGPMSVYDDGAPPLDPDLLTRTRADGSRLPVLGICYGMQALAFALGGAVEPSQRREYGRAHLIVGEPLGLMADVEDGAQVWMSHGDHLTRLPDGFHHIAHTENAPIAAVRSETHPFYGVQFHPEVVHTKVGAQILENFVRTICGGRGDWSAASFIEEQKEKVRAQVGDAHVILGLSGGVDSSVAAVLLHEALGDQLTCIFVDNGLLRADEFEEVQHTFRDGFDLDLVAVPVFPRSFGAIYATKLYRNDASEGSAPGGWLKLKLEGTASNRAGLGTILRAETTIGGVAQTLTREVSAQNTFNGHSSLYVHFGLGDAAQIDRLTIAWPSGMEDVFENVAPNRFVIAEEGGGLTPVTSEPVAPRTPDRLALDAAYPTPFATTPRLAVTLPRATEATLVVYDVLGRRVATLANEQSRAGTQAFAWTPDAALANGVYVAVLRADGQTVSRRLSLQR